MKRFISVLLAGFVSSGLVGSARAQEGAAGSGREPGTLGGRVMDATGQVLPGATVDIEPRGLRLTTDLEGRFTASSLPAGDYRLKVSYVGFKDDEEAVR